MCKSSVGFQGQIAYNQYRANFQQIQIPHHARGDSYTFLFRSKASFLDLLLTNDEGVRTILHRQLASFPFGRKYIFEIYDSDFPERNIYGQTVPFETKDEIKRVMPL